MKLYSLLDLETTGFADDGAVIPQQIIEAAAIVVDETGAIQRVYYGRFTPTIPVLPGAARVNGYTPEAWAGWPELGAHDLNTLAAFLDGTQVVGSMPAFDAARIDEEIARVGGRAPVLSTHRRLDLGSVGAPLVEGLELTSGGMVAIVEGLASVGLPVPPMPDRLREMARGRDGAHTAMGDAWRLLHVMTTVYWPAVAEWKKIGMRRLS
jgi:hypothetical protein